VSNALRSDSAPTGNGQPLLFLCQGVVIRAVFCTDHEDSLMGGELNWGVETWQSDWLGGDHNSQKVIRV